MLADMDAIAIRMPLAGTLIPRQAHQSLRLARWLEILALAQMLDKKH